MTRPSSDHWQTGDPDLEHRAAELFAAHVDAHVVLVQLARDPGTAPDPEQDDHELAALWHAAAGTRNSDLDGRRLSWRSFVLLVHGDSTAVRAAIARASQRIPGAAQPWRLSVQWAESSGDFLADVKGLETRARLEP